MIEKDSDVLQAYLRFKERDYGACLQEMSSDAVSSRPSPHP